MKINNINGTSFNGLRFKNISGQNMKKFIIPYFSQLELLGEKADLLITESVIPSRGVIVPALDFKASAITPLKGHYFKSSATTQYATESGKFCQIYEGPLQAAQVAVTKASMGLS